MTHPTPQVDWSQAPEGAVAHVVSSDLDGWWLVARAHILSASALSVRTETFGLPSRTITIRPDPALVAEVESLRAQLAAVSAENAQLRAQLPQWRPISEAPRDGAQFLIVMKWGDRFDYEVGRYKPYVQKGYEKAEGGLFREVDEVISEFTHSYFDKAVAWMALVPPAGPIRKKSQPEPATEGGGHE